MVSCTGAIQVNLYEAGMLIAYIPGAAPENPFMLIGLSPVFGLFLWYIKRKTDHSYR